MEALFAVVVVYLILIVPPAFLGAGWYFGSAKKHGRFRKEYERSIFRFCVTVLTLSVGGFFIYGFVDALGRSSPYRSGFRNAADIVSFTLILGVVYLLGLWFSHCAVVGVRRTFPKESRILVYLGALLGGALGPVGLGLLWLLGFGEPSQESRPAAHSSSQQAPAPIKSDLVSRLGLFGKLLKARRGS